MGRYVLPPARNVLDHVPDKNGHSKLEKTADAEICVSWYLKGGPYDECAAKDIYPYPQKVGFIVFDGFALSKVHPIIDRGWKQWSERSHVRQISPAPWNLIVHRSHRQEYLDSQYHLDKDGLQDAGVAASIESQPLARVSGRVVTDLTRRLPALLQMSGVRVG